MTTPLRDNVSTGAFTRAAWLWKPGRYQGEAGAQRLRQTIRTWELTALYVQWVPDSTLLAHITRHADREGVAVWALGGDPAWVTPAPGDTRYQEAADLVDAAAGYNERARQAGEPLLRGVHLDVEPYALPAWALQRREITERWKELVRLTSRRARSAGLSVGYAIPAWDPEGSTSDPEPSTSDSEASTVDPEGSTVDPAVPGGTTALMTSGGFIETVLQNADEVAIMSYRRRATGPNSTSDIIAPVRRVGNALAESGTLTARLLVGMETAPLSTSTVRFLTAVAPPARPQDLPLRDERGRRVVLLHSGRAWLLGLAVPAITPAGSDHVPPPATGEELLDLARLAEFPVTAESEVIALARRALRQCEGYEHGAYREVELSHAAEAKYPVVAIEAEEYPPRGVSFHGCSGEAIREAVHKWEQLFRATPDVSGLAIHNFETLDDLTG